MNDSTSPPPSDDELYAALIKPGDAVQTPDEALWVVEEAGATLKLISAYRDQAGQICADHIDQVRTSVPDALVTKVADARQVRR